MSYSNEWLQFRTAEEIFFNRQSALMQNEEKMISDLQLALSSVDDKETAMRFLLDTRPRINIIILLISKIVDLSIDSSNEYTISLARNIIYFYKDDSKFKAHVTKKIYSYYSSEDDWNFRRIAELYKFLDYKEELTSFVKLCQMNDNPEIKEVGDDFLPYT